MPKTSQVFFFATVCLSCCSASGQIKESSSHYDSGGKQISFELFEPTTPGPHPAVVVLPGTFGLLAPWGDDIRSFSRVFAEKNIVAMIPSYFDRTDTRPGAKTTAIIAQLVPRHGAQWNSAIEDGIAFLASRPNVDEDRIGLLGFSLGGNRALTIGMQPTLGTKIQRIADFFGPTTSIPLGGDITNLPKLQVHHGDEDLIVRPRESRKLIQRLEAKGRVEGTDFEAFWYPGEGHGFKDPALTESRKRTIKFFQSL